MTLYSIKYLVDTMIQNKELTVEQLIGAYRLRDRMREALSAEIERLETVKENCKNEEHEESIAEIDEGEICLHCYGATCRIAFAKELLGSEKDVKYEAVNSRKQESETQHPSENPKGQKEMQFIKLEPEEKKLLLKVFGFEVAIDGRIHRAGNAGYEIDPYTKEALIFEKLCIMPKKAGGLEPFMFNESPLSYAIYFDEIEEEK